MQQHSTAWQKRPEPQPERPKPQEARYLTETEKKSLGAQPWAPSYIKAEPEKYEVLWLGGRNFLYSKTWAEHDVWIETIRRHELWN